MPADRLRAFLVTILIGLATLSATLPALPDAGAERLDGMFGLALKTFAATRALNAVISVIQGTELALQPAGVGVTITVGEALDPLNDLIERFSWIMLAATAALGTQAVLMEASAAPALTILLLAIACLTVARIWWPPLARADGPALLPRLLVLLLFVRLALPLAALGSESFSRHWLEQRRAQAVTTLTTTREALDAIERRAPRPPADDVGMLESMRRYIDTQTARLDLEARLTELSARLDTAAERIVDLVVVFTLQTIVVPLAVLWLLWRLARFVQPPPWSPPYGNP